MDIVKHLLDAILTKKVEVATVDVSLSKELERLNDEHDAMHKEMQNKIDAYVAELKEQHKPICKEQKQKIQAVWERIYDAAGFTGDEREQPYSINHETGVLSRKEIDPIFKKKIEEAN